MCLDGGDTLAHCGDEATVEAADFVEECVGGGLQAPARNGGADVARIRREPTDYSHNVTVENSIGAPKRHTGYGRRRVTPDAGQLKQCIVILRETAG